MEKQLYPQFLGKIFQVYLSSQFVPKKNKPTQQSELYCLWIKSEALLYPPQNMQC